MPITIGNITFDIDTLLYGAMAIILGLQTIEFAVFSKVIAIEHKMLPKDDKLTQSLKVFTLERGIAIGVTLLVIGIIISAVAVDIWGKASYGTLNARFIMRITVPALTLVITGIQMIFASFLLHILDVNYNNI
jgi:hypothetical protein